MSDSVLISCSPVLDRYLRDHAELSKDRQPWRHIQCRQDFEQAVLPLLSMRDEPGFMSALRRLRTGQQMQFIYRELHGVGTLQERMRELSDFADVCVEAVLHWLDPEDRWGLIVFALGKLGGHELNLSSDIDLVVSCVDASHAEQAQRCMQQFIRIMAAATADGFVFRVDLRLRPWGEGSALVVSLPALESYYERHGRDWERYAWIKARVIAGRLEEAEGFLRRLRPFVYRRYLDMAAVHGLSHMKAQIEREERRADVLNIKTGKGGIREVEFVVQAFQLLRGGMDGALQTSSILAALDVLEQRPWLPVSVVQQLRQDYLWLRRLEHLIQAQEDQQTQLLPRDEQMRTRLIRVLGYESWSVFELELDRCQERVHDVFCSVIAEPAHLIMDVDPEFRDLWLGILDQPVAWLAGFGVDADAWNELLVSFRKTRALRALSAVARGRLDDFMARLLQQATQLGCTADALRSVLNWVEQVAGRSVYLLQTGQTADGLLRLLRMGQQSPGLLDMLGRYPAVLDDVLSGPVLAKLPTLEEFRQDLGERLIRLPEQDTESILRTLRWFHKAHLIRIAQAEIEHQCTFRDVSEALCCLAEAILEQVVFHARRTLEARYGLLATSFDFMIIAYGKLGSRELGYASDLDLVFIYEATGNDQSSAGQGPDPAVAAARLGQTIIHFLSAPMAEGTLYEVDMQLRPSGHSGLLVSSWKAFIAYQSEKAWIWEHQALVKARPVFGSMARQEQFTHLRHSLLMRARNPIQLARELTGMRQKMRQHGKKAVRHGAELFDIKHDPGGLVDLEFMVQWVVLSQAHDVPVLATETHTGTLLALMGALGLFSRPRMEALLAAWSQYHQLLHQRGLLQKSSVVLASEVGSWPAVVQKQWEEWLGSQDW